MGVFRNVLRFLAGGGTSRGKGIQSGSPGSYAVPAATVVTVDSALQLSAVWACTRILTEAIGSLPIRIFDVAPDGTQTLNRDHHLNRLFSGKINKWQTRQEYFESITYQLVLLGNNYSAIQRNGQGDIISLTPLMTPQMQVELEENGQVTYQYQESSSLKVFSPESIWHNKLFGNGVVGLSPLGFARNSVGIGQAAELATTNIYKNGGKPSGLLTIDKILTTEQRAAIKKNFSELSEGNSDRLFVLEADMKYKQVSLSPTDIELLASRNFQVEDICRFFNVPSVLVNAPSSTSLGTGIGQIIQGFFKFGLRPNLTRYESSMEVNLLKPEERGRIKIEFDINSLLQADRKDRLKSSKEGVTGGIISPNEAREVEGLAPKEGGDSLIVQQQMVPIDEIAGMLRGGTSNDQDS